MKKFNYTRLTPFKWYVLENFPFIEADFDALTEWQLFCKLGKEINKILNSTNLLGNQVQELTDFVSEYFDNLDIQDEINNKLNEMAESGQLAEIIAQFIEMQGLLMFNTKNDMKTATNLRNGSFTKTLGNTNYLDGDGFFYKIRTITNQDIIDDNNIVALLDETLIAEKIPTIDKTKYFDNVSEMKTAELKNGDFVNTLGFYNINDGGKALYKIRELEDEETANEMNLISLQNENLVAELICNKVNVLQFGAKGDNETDDTLVFQTASNYASSHKLEFYVPNKTFILGSVTLNNIKLINIKGFLKMTDNETKLNIFENVNGDTPNIYINKVYPGTIEMKGLNSADITIQNTYKLRLVADNTENHNFIAYSKFYLGFIRYLELWDDNSGTKWINENLFIGGRYLGISIDGGYPHQDNLFLKPMCENTIININKGHGNRIIDARLEGSGVSITFGETTYQNIITTNYSGTLQTSLLPKELTGLNITDNSNGLNSVIRNENLNENLVLRINAFNPYNSQIEGDLLKPSSTNIFESNLIALPNIDVCLYLKLSDPNIAWRIECYDVNKQKLTTNPDLLKNSPTISYTSQGTYGNATYTRNTYWAILDSSNTQVKYIKIKLYKQSSAPVNLTLKSIEMFLTYYGLLNDKGYYLEGLSKSIS